MSDTHHRQEMDGGVMDTRLMEHPAADFAVFTPVLDMQTSPLFPPLLLKNVRSKDRTSLSGNGRLSAPVWEGLRSL